MTNLIQRVALFALYQLSIIVGILLLPIALLVRRAGVTLPVHRLVRTVERTYDRTV